MGRPKKNVPPVPELTLVEKKYIDLSLKTENNVNYDQLFKRLSVELDKPEVLIRGYADKLHINVQETNLPPEPPPKVISPDQEFVRNSLTPNRKNEPNKARHITVMSDSASSIIEKSVKVSVNGSQKFNDCIFRQ